MEHCIILVRPETSANIGAVCRAMATANLHDLRIVGNRSDYDETVIERLALKAFYIWKAARFFEPSICGLQEATRDTEILFGTTRRTGKKRTNRFLSLYDCVETLLKKQYIKAGFVFGNERTGLSDEELSVCNASVYIPTAQNFGSLNLSHAVQIVGYELFKGACQTLAETAEKTLTQQQAIPQEKVEAISEAIIEGLLARGFFRAGGSTENKKFFRDILTRAELSEFEAGHILDLLKKLKEKARLTEK